MTSCYSSWGRDGLAKLKLAPIYSYLLNSLHLHNTSWMKGMKTAKRKTRMFGSMSGKNFIPI